METPMLVLAAITLCGAAALASCKKDESAQLDANGNLECGTCERIAVKCEGSLTTLCVPKLEDAQPQNCIPEMSLDCTPGSGGSGGAGG